MSYDDQYSQTRNLFGVDPELSLCIFADRLDGLGPVLDVGAGQGRNALWLASRGIEVHALEPSAVACKGLMRHPDLKVINSGFQEIEVPVGGYSGVMVFGLIPDLDLKGTDQLLTAIRVWTRPGSLVWVTGFTTDDPAYSSFCQKWRAMGPNSFSNDAGRIRTYLEPDQILTLFAPWKPIHHREFLGPEHCHGDSPPERHAMFEAVFRVR